MLVGDVMCLGSKFITLHYQLLMDEKGYRPVRLTSSRVVSCPQGNRGSRLIAGDGQMGMEGLPYVVHFVQCLSFC